MSFPGAIRAGSLLQLLRDRVGENPAKLSKQGTGWGPDPGSRRVVLLRPRGGRLIFYCPRGMILLS